MWPPCFEVCESFVIGGRFTPVLHLMTVTSVFCNGFLQTKDGIVELTTWSCVKSENLKFVVEGDGFAGQLAL